MALPQFQEKTIKETSIPHPGGDGDSHTHVYPTGCTITDRFKGGGYEHTRFDDNGNPR
jgi:hypothetical protein